jgi:hypothetical protein
MVGMSVHTISPITEDGVARLDLQPKEFGAMTLSTKALVAAAATALSVCVFSLPASAFYLGYANGDPENWGFYQEQHNGASPPAATTLPVGPSHAYIIHNGRAYVPVHEEWRGRTLDQMP